MSDKDSFLKVQTIHGEVYVSKKELLKALKEDHFLTHLRYYTKIEKNEIQSYLNIISLSDIRNDKAVVTFLKKEHPYLLI